MPGNSQRKGAVRKRGKGNTAGSGGRVRRGLEGKGPTPKAEDRPYHSAYRTQQSSTKKATGGRGGNGQRPRTGKPGSGPEWVAGRNAVLEALAAEIPAKTAYVVTGAERDDRLRDIFKLAASRSLPMLEVTRAELDRFTGGAVHQGVALRLPEFNYAHPDDLLASALESDTVPLIVALDSVTDPRNLGAIVRSAVAFGAHGVLIPERRSAGMTAAAWKTSAGAAARINVARAKNLTRTLKAYADAGLFLVGLDADGDVDIADVAAASGPLVLVVGSEGAGLSRLVGETCDTVASIPMSAKAESLNAGVAAGIALYEISRRR
ncbi:MAG: 23S rRNA (guanosine(2251)-2'-O)-methyltransferase RlmB [Microlunatus sp.]|nr:23S rRNA (guanosine(2251)-2'-O)-methyltransferase RlmB [Microlunatus sp.]MDN5770103.1 23S rRNA (guanosine(2251)-2'-O)-methyltransferase RlmB [Microlunatus sp.]MDN5804428.1 23S rRNA (guanosine(2251)-2'-O)-methyltransferase RlmB [Microlunatus sp.]